jgi:hypothetical protein
MPPPMPVKDIYPSPLASSMSKPPYIGHGVSVFKEDTMTGRR